MNRLQEITLRIALWSRVRSLLGARSLAAAPVCTVVGRGRALAIRLAAGQAHELPLPALTCSGLIDPASEVVD